MINILVVEISDFAIAEHFAKEFKSKYKIDVHENPKAFYRVLLLLKIEKFYRPTLKLLSTLNPS